ncbi:TIGR02281 family clan AA aspartic protease [Ciceribacter sp. L1K23]|uniref:TIGR02281 family clan AA aspartic protease n=1 Tax=Ciceribacter sp. L1K23 TaxID=2820276 RepID=UPI001B818F98|nr:TIGR02281 family clan AA aspartic protease [Ciceribacter sp. L1K23]MBR0555215.1 TIGR02281 family clan AA aspartic protease [Ciceribacter sp. L1K23]
MNNDSGRSFGMDNDRFGEMITLLPFAALIGAGILASRRSLGESARQLLIWVVIVLALVTGYVYRGDLMAVGDRVLASLVPGRAVVVEEAEGVQSVILHKSMGGHFEATVDVNGTGLPMLVDTGASSVALSWDDAIRAGIDPQSLTFSRTILTANGTAQAAPVRLRSVSIGPIWRENVEALVTEQGKLSQSLLGMSFIGTLGALEMRADELRLRN